MTRQRNVGVVIGVDDIFSYRKLEITLSPGVAYRIAYCYDKLVVRGIKG